MEPKLYLRFSDLFDRQPVTDEIVELLTGIPVRHAIYILSSMNLCLRTAMESALGDFGRLQEKLLATHFDAECLTAVKIRFPHVRCDERPVFFPECLLNVMRLVIVHGDPNPLPILGEDERLRYLIGRACLMSNDLLVSGEQEDALKSGTLDARRVELMTQWLSSFELAHPPRPDHLMPRLEIMFRVLLRDSEVKRRIVNRSGGFDMEAEFSSRLGVALEHWLFIVFAIYALSYLRYMPIYRTSAQ